MKNDEWLTPPEILAALGPFDLDPCAPVVRPWDTASAHYTKETGNDKARGGMNHPWTGRVWLNPPFGRHAHMWMLKMMSHGNGIALVPARTETAMFYECVWNVADAVCFLKGRPHFHRVDGSRAPFNSGAPIALVAYGSSNATVLRSSGLGFTTDARAAMAGESRPSKGERT